MSKSTEVMLNEVISAKSEAEMDELNKSTKAKSFGTRLDEHCARKGISLNVLADLTAIKPSTIYNLASSKKTGKQSTTKARIIKIGFALDLSLEEVQELLKLAGLKELYAKDDEQRWIIYALTHENPETKQKYDIMELDELLNKKITERKLNFELDEF
ncbi:MAG: hypothetical protein IKB72_03770 [Ruminococcus sp.]|nr:hypothetical protein [Ruminococcus sp.]